MKIGSSTFDLSRPIIMGVLNVTPDSFSDGGTFYTHDVAVGRALTMAAEGADIIDIGGESSRPGSEPVSVEEEFGRIVTVISAIRQKSKVPISIDTVKSAVARKAIELGANMINDVSAGTFDPEMFNVAASSGVPICLMHIRGAPRTMQSGNIHYDDVVADVVKYLKERADAAMSAGIKKENILIDPGIGFGKTAEHNIEILKRLSEFKTLGLPIVIGTSRKSFIGKILNEQNPKARLEGSLATVAIAYQNGANVLRVHDVSATKKFLTVLARF